MKTKMKLWTAKCKLCPFETNNSMIMPLHLLSVPVNRKDGYTSSKDGKIYPSHGLHPTALWDIGKYHDIVDNRSNSQKIFSYASACSFNRPKRERKRILKHAFVMYHRYGFDYTVKMLGRMKDKGVIQ